MKVFLAKCRRGGFSQGALRTFYCSAYLVAIGAVVFSIFRAGWGQGWARFGIVAMLPKFADFRSIQGALASELTGQNPYVSNPGDPWGRLLNYPHVWVDVGRFLHIEDEVNFTWLCALIILAFVVCCFDLIRRYPSVPMLFAICSSAALLGVERCNNDLVIFVLLYLASFLYAKNWFLLPLAVASLLKIFPLFALSVPLVLHRWRTFFAALIPALLGGVWFRQEISDLRHATPGSAGMSYGISSVAKLIGDHPSSYAVLLVAVAALVIIVFRASNRFVASPVDAFSHEFILFLTGASIYVGTYLFASNWDYRLMFLIFCVPYLRLINYRSAFVMLILSLVAMNFQLGHGFKTKMAVAIVNWFDLTDIRWVEVFRIPWFVADHAVKAMLFALLLGVLLRCLFFCASKISVPRHFTGN